MKKIFMILTIVASLGMTGCSNTNVNNVLDTISSGIETGLNNVSDFISKLATSKPATVFPKTPTSRYFVMENYKIDIKYVDGVGLELWAGALIENKTNSRLNIIIDFPIYDLNGKIVDKGVMSRSSLIMAEPQQMSWAYDQYRLNRDLRINADQVRTRVYLNGKLIANTHPQPAKTTTKKVTAPKVQEPKQPVVENSTSPKPRQTRQSISK